MKRDMTAAYQAAERLLPWNTEDAVLNGKPHIQWLDDTHFYYGKERREGDNVITEFFCVNCADGTETLLFDHTKLAALLECEHLPFRTCHLEDGLLTFSVQDNAYTYHLTEGTLTCKPQKARHPSCTSPDGRYELFLDQYNLFLRETATGKETPLTFDGEKDFSYATGAEYSGVVGEKLSGIVPAPDVLWSPDSTLFLTYRLDQRLVPELYVLESYDRPDCESIRPRLHTYKCPFPEDEFVPMATYYLCDVTTGAMQKLNLPQQMTGGSLLRPEYSIAKWLPDSSAFYTTHVARGNKSASLILANREGSYKTIVTETVEDFLNLDTYGDLDGFRNYRFSNFITDDQTTAIWQSERDNLARLFRYNTADGTCEGAITPADCLVGQIIAKDDETGFVYFMASNLTQTSDPYYQLLCRVRYDGSDFSVLTPEDGMHHSTVNGDYIVDTWSRIDLPPVTVLRRTDGTFLREVVRSDVSDLMARGYIMPERFSVTASDGKTILYGILVKPVNCDPAQTYPFIDYIYGGMQCYNVPKAFTWKGAVSGREAMGGLQEFAQLGFAGIILDGLGTPGRGKHLHNISYENIHGCAGLKDHITTMEQLKEQFPFLDLNRAGMWGNSGGGCATSRAMLEYPDAYKVGVSSAGNHDQRMYNNWWTENYYGLYNKEIYMQGDNTALAKNLKGHLFIVHGAMDDNVAMSQSIRLIDALIREDKDFDFLILPRTDHNVPADPYFIRRKLDYFVQHLLGEEPPAYRFVKPEKEQH